jgi:hypothetical protein
MPNIQKEKKKSNMEPWLLNWTSFILSNTQAEIDGLKYADGPEWTQRMFESWKKNSDLGRKLLESEAEERNTITYKLDPEETKTLKEWQEHIKAIYGMYGDYVYTFESGGGIGTIKRVWSKLANTELDLTDIDTW